MAEMEPVPAAGGRWTAFERSITMKKILLIAIAAVASSCSLPQKVQLGGESGLGNKVVSAKEEPATLVAVDGTLCLVTADRFDRVKAGDRVWCSWRPRGAG